jgi:hypothetical protein
MPNKTLLRVVSKRQAAFFQRILDDLDAAGRDVDAGTGYRVEQLRAALTAVDVSSSRTHQIIINVFARADSVV